MAKYKRTFYRDGDRYIFLTGAAPRGFAGVLGITWEGPAPDQLAETARPLDQLAKLGQVAPAAVPLEWWEGFRKATGLLAERKPEPPPTLEPDEPEEEDEPEAPEIPFKETWTFGLAIAIGTALGLLALRWIP